MHEILISKLHQYLRKNNPDLLLQLEKENKVEEYLEEKVNSVDISAGEEISMDQLTEDLRPSKYNYILSVLQDEFPIDYMILSELKVLESQIIHIIRLCDPIMEEHNFSINEDDRFLRYAIVGTIREYLDGE